MWFGYYTMEVHSSYLDQREVKEPLVFDLSWVTLETVPVLVVVDVPKNRPSQVPSHTFGAKSIGTSAKKNPKIVKQIDTCFA